MNQPSLLPEELDTMHALSHTSSMSRSEPASNTTITNDLKTHPTQTGALTIAGLEIPNYIFCCGFYELVSSITYGKFLVGLAKLNPNSLTRAAAEEAWWTITQEKFREWDPPAEVYDQEKKRLLRKMASSQMHGKGLKHFDVQMYWAMREEVRRNVEIVEQERLRRERRMRNRMILAQRREKTKAKRAEKKVESLSSMTLQLRPKPEAGSEKPLSDAPAIFLNIAELKIEEGGDEVKLQGSE